MSYQDQSNSNSSQGNNGQPPSSNAQHQQQQLEEAQSMPTAPYPPMISARYPSAHVSTMRSSMTTSPHYSSVGAEQQQQQQQQQQLLQPQQRQYHSMNKDDRQNANSASSSQQQRQHQQQQQQQQQQQSQNRRSHSADSATTPKAGTTANTGTPSITSTSSSGGQQAQRSSRVQFANANMVACINCADIALTPSAADQQQQQQQQQPAEAPTPSATTTTTTTTTPRIHRKLGPILLELRQLQMRPQQPHYSYSQSAQQQHNAAMIHNQELFCTRTVALSRGNPSLGTSVSSTCLDVSTILPVGGVSSYNSNSTFNSGSSSSRPPPCATGLTTGALCIHTFTEDNNSNNSTQQNRNGEFAYTSQIEYFHTPRHHRPAAAVSWRTHNSRHVAIGLVSSAMAGGTPTTTAATSSRGGHHGVRGGSAGGGGGERGGGPSNPALVGKTGMGGGNGSGGGGGGGGGGGDREFCCFLWDIEHQSTGTRKQTNTSPLFKLSHNAGVASLAWLLEGGQTLAVGGQQRNIQLYDLRVSGTSSATPPISALCHNFGVHGIQVDPFRPHQFATYCRAAGEPVKIWDARRMESALSEIKLPQSTNTSTTSTSTSSSSYDTLVSSLRWSSRESGVLSVALGDVVQDYDTVSSSRPVLMRVNRAKGPILDMALYPGSFPKDPAEMMPTAMLTTTKTTTTTTTTSGTAMSTSTSTSTSQSAPSNQQKQSQATEQQQQLVAEHNNNKNNLQLISELYSHRMLVILADDRAVHDMAKHTIAPLAVSRRDGRVLHALGKHLFLGSTRSGPAAMERGEPGPYEDISATMMRRARCLHETKYSMDTTSNIKILAEEVGPYRDALLRLWTWIDRMESLANSSSSALNSNNTNTNINNEETSGASNGMDDGGVSWAMKGLEDTGVWKLLQMGKDENTDQSYDSIVHSDSLGCNVYDSPVRRAALTACGWTGRFELSNVLAECESFGEYERSAALAVFHGSLGSAVDALQRGADAIYAHLADKTRRDIPATAPQYAETLQLVAMCIAGYGGADSKSPASSVWRRACESLMQRPDLNGGSFRTSRTAYLRALCTFLVNISTGRSFDELLGDSYLSLCDRVAFACRFLGREQLKGYLQNCIDSCQASGNIEGLVITGIDKEGMKILHSFVDKTADVQTAALVTSRIILPSDWTTERRICAEFLESYRTLLNTWQMWQSRAMFDVDRAELVRKIKIRQADAQATNAKPMNFQGRRIQAGRRQGSRQPDPDIVPSVPAQLDARCTYCSSSLGLKRLDNHANQWLSKMKPVLSCCPSCQKPLPRCAICLLSLGCLNPYIELTRERERSRPSRGGASLQSPDDLSSLANLPFAEWFTWCMTCKHGGHAHHLVGWFANHEVCPVSGCDCRCQFDGIQKLNRPALSKNPGPNGAETPVSPSTSDDAKNHDDDE